MMNVSCRAPAPSRPIPFHAMPRRRGETLVMSPTQLPSAEQPVPTPLNPGSYVAKKARPVQRRRVRVTTDRGRGP